MTGPNLPIGSSDELVRTPRNDHKLPIHLAGERLTKSFSLRPLLAFLWLFTASWLFAALAYLWSYPILLIR